MSRIRDRPFTGPSEPKVAERMYTYNYRLCDCHQQRVISLVALADKEISWQPSRYSYSCRHKG